MNNLLKKVDSYAEKCEFKKKYLGHIISDKIIEIYSCKKRPGVPGSVEHNWSTYSTSWLLVCKESSGVSVKLKQKTKTKTKLLSLYHRVIDILTKKNK